MHACDLCINGDFENSCPRTGLRQTDAVHAFKPNGTFVKVLDRLRCRNSSFVSSPWNIQLCVEIGSFSLSETCHIVHDDVEHHHRRRRLRQRRFKGQLHNSNNALCIWRDDFDSKVLYSRLENSGECYAAITQKRKLRLRSFHEGILDAKVLKIFWSINILIHLSHFVKTMLELLQRPEVNSRALEIDYADC